MSRQENIKSNVRKLEAYKFLGQAIFHCMLKIGLHVE
jgi:hypothetical protein